MVWWLSFTVFRDNRSILMLLVRHRPKKIQTRAGERIDAGKNVRVSGGNFGLIGIILSQHLACLRTKSCKVCLTVGFATMN